MPFLSPNQQCQSTERNAKQLDLCGVCGCRQAWDEYFPGGRRWRTAPRAWNDQRHFHAAYFSDANARVTCSRGGSRTWTNSPSARSACTTPAAGTVAPLPLTYGAHGRRGWGQKYPLQYYVNLSDKRQQCESQWLATRWRLPKINNNWSVIYSLWMWEMYASHRLLYLITTYFPKKGKTEMIVK